MLQPSHHTFSHPETSENIKYAVSKEQKLFFSPPPVLLSRSQRTYHRLKWDSFVQMRLLQRVNWEKASRKCKKQTTILLLVLDDTVAQWWCLYSTLQFINRLCNQQFVEANIVLNYGQIYFVKGLWLQKASNTLSEDSRLNSTFIALLYCTEVIYCFGFDPAGFKKTYQMPCSYSWIHQSHLNKWHYNDKLQQYAVFHN